MYVRMLEQRHVMSCTVPPSPKPNYSPPSVLCSTGEQPGKSGQQYCQRVLTPPLSTDAGEGHRAVPFPSMAGPWLWFHLACHA